MNDKDAVWLVTGGSRGIGRAVAERARVAGHRVAVLARGAADEPADGLLHVRADVSKPAEVDAAVQQVLDTYGRLDVVVNNAGLHRGGRVSRIALEDWQSVIDTNLNGALHVIRAADPHLTSGACIINIGAVVGFRGFPGDSAYASSKAGLSGLTRALAIEMAARGVRVNLVIPGLVLTEMTGALSEKALDSMRSVIPMGRFGEAAEIADAVYSVAGATYMTGAFIPCDGGLMSSFGMPG